MPIKTVSATQLNSWLNKDEAVLIDVREPAEHTAKKISKATLSPLGTISINKLPKTNGKKLVLHCHSGKRSTNACQKLIKEAPNLEIYNLEGGITAWIQAGFDIKKSEKFFLPLDQQVQLTIGLCVLAGSILTYFINPLFTIFTGLFGAGLIVAGITGFCGLASLMAKMPWNKNITKKYHVF